MYYLIKMLGVALGLLTVGRTMAAATTPVPQSFAHDAIGPCAGTYFPSAATELQFAGNYYLQYFDTQKLHDSWREATASQNTENSQYLFFNRNYVMSRMGGFMENCGFVLNTIMATGQEPNYARLFNAVLGAFLDLDIMLFSRDQVPKQSVVLAAYFQDKKQLSLYPFDEMKSQKRYANLVSVSYIHENIHALIDASRNSTCIEAYLKNNTQHVAIWKEKFQKQHDSFMSGIHNVRKAKEQLMKYRYKKEQLSPDETNEIEKQIAFANQMVEQHGVPSINFIIEKEKSGVVYKNKKGYLQDVMKKPEYNITAKLEHPCQFVEEYKLKNNKIWYFVGFTDPLLTYLEIFLRIHDNQARSTTYARRLEEKDAEEYFAFIFSSVPWPMAERFFPELHEEFLSILSQVERNLPQTAPTLSFGSSSLYHPAYTNAMEIFNDVFEPKFLTANNLESYIAHCEMVIRTADKKRYFLVEETLRNIIQSGLLSVPGKLDAQLDLAEVLYRQNKWDEAHQLFHHVAKSGVKFTPDKLLHYQSIVTPDNKKPGDDNYIKHAQNKLKQKNAEL